MSPSLLPPSKEEIIQFFYEEVDFKLNDSSIISEWILDTIHFEEKKVKLINFIFCNDKYLHLINVEYLNHDTLTDIITFPFSYNPIESDIFISLERVKENALKFNVSFVEELHRILIHGVLHLIGYNDKSTDDKILIREKENEYLQILKNSTSI